MLNLSSLSPAVLNTFASLGSQATLSNKKTDNENYTLDELTKFPSKVSFIPTGFTPKDAVTTIRDAESKVVGEIIWDSNGRFVHGGKNENGIFQPLDYEEMLNELGLEEKYSAELISAILRQSKFMQSPMYDEDHAAAVVQSNPELVWWDKNFYDKNMSFNDKGFVTGLRVNNETLPGLMASMNYILLTLNEEEKEELIAQVKRVGKSVNQTESREGEMRNDEHLASIIQMIENRKMENIEVSQHLNMRLFTTLEQYGKADNDYVDALASSLDGEGVWFGKDMKLHTEVGGIILGISNDIPSPVMLDTTRVNSPYYDYRIDEELIESGKDPISPYRRFEVKSEGIAYWREISEEMRTLFDESASDEEKVEAQKAIDGITENISMLMESRKAFNNYQDFSPNDMKGEYFYDSKFKGLGKSNLAKAIFLERRDELSATEELGIQFHDNGRVKTSKEPGISPQLVRRLNSAAMVTAILDVNSFENSEGEMVHYAGYKFAQAQTRGLMIGPTNLQETIANKLSKAVYRLENMVKISEIEDPKVKIGDLEPDTLVYVTNKKEVLTLDKISEDLEEDMKYDLYRSEQPKEDGVSNAIFSLIDDLADDEVALDEVLTSPDKEYSDLLKTTKIGDIFTKDRIKWENYALNSNPNTAKEIATMGVEAAQLLLSDEEDLSSNIKFPTPEDTSRKADFSNLNKAFLDYVKNLLGSGEIMKRVAEYREPNYSGNNEEPGINDFFFNEPTILMLRKLNSFLTMVSKGNTSYGQAYNTASPEGYAESEIDPTIEPNGERFGFDEVSKERLLDIVGEGKELNKSFGEKTKEYMAQIREAQSKNTPKKPIVSLEEAEKRYAEGQVQKTTPEQKEADKHLREEGVEPIALSSEGQSTTSTEKLNNLTSKISV